jgi:hypothetical protein
MEFTTEGKSVEWKRRFAFLPTRVGVTDEGRLVWCWFQHYLQRRDCWRKRRPLVESEGVDPIEILYRG